MHEADAALEEATGYEAFGAEVWRNGLVEAVEFLGGFGFVGEVGEFGGELWMGVEVEDGVELKRELAGTAPMVTAHGRAST